MSKGELKIHFFSEIAGDAFFWSTFQHFLGEHNYNPLIGRGSFTPSVRIRSPLRGLKMSNNKISGI